MPQQRDEWAGRTLAATYLLERRLSTGGMGTVYLGRHLRTGGLCAVKLLHLDRSDREAYRRFQDEARIISALRHPHIVQVTDFDEDAEGNPFIVMELLEGEDLQRRLAQLGRLQLGDALVIARQVCSALQAAHEIGIIHRDIKPQNIFLCRHRTVDGTQDSAKVVDFGVSKAHDASGMTQAATLLGTPQYMAPEAARGQHADIDGRSDQFSLAVILYRALSGRLPFPGPDMVAALYQVVHEEPPPLRALCPEVPEPVAAAVTRALSKRREDRFPTMIEFAHALIVPAGQNAHAEERTVVPQHHAPPLPHPTPSSLGPLPSPRLQARPDAATQMQMPVVPLSVVRSQPALMQPHPQRLSPSQVTPVSVSRPVPAMDQHGGYHSNSANLANLANPAHPALRDPPSRPPGFPQHSAALPVQSMLEAGVMAGGTPSTLTRATAQTGRLGGAKAHRGALAGVLVVIGLALSAWLVRTQLLGRAVMPVVSTPVLAPEKAAPRDVEQPEGPAAAQQPVRRGMVTWSVTSEPAGAKVVRMPDRMLLGQTPYQRDAPARGGTILVVVQAPGYREQRLLLDQGTNERRHVRLAPLHPAAPRVVAPPPAQGVAPVAPLGPQPIGPAEPTKEE